ncbi:hypothetical protein BJY01DRAFT_225220 [Aspergillus pseudoustus]|uniref:WW domain-containing protein n=1 Tax=Aspergillus pseudoustus TaxID=1810923 RepID=A0ABR4J0D3_9EURO
MTNGNTEDAPEGVPTLGSSVPHSREDVTTVTTQAEKKEEEHTREQSQEIPQAQEKESEHGQEGEESVAEEGETKEQESGTAAPPLPDEIPPPLPNEAPPGKGEDDGWEPVWDASAQAYYFYNRFTGVSQWDNPRVPDSSKVSAPAPAPAAAAAPGTVDEDASATEKTSPPAVGGYNPAIHGDYDPTAPYAQQYEQQDEGNAAGTGGVANPGEYGAVGSFNRFTGRWQGESQNPEYHNDENKSRRQMNAYFDVDAAANSHDGRSLRAERSAKKLSKKELKMFKEKRREKKEEKRRAWLRD